MIVRTVLMTLIALAIGCGYTLPEPIYANQVEEYFPEPTEAATDVAPGGEVGAEGAGEVGTGEVDVGTGEVAAGEVAAGEVAAGEVAAGEVAAGEVAAGEVAAVDAAAPASTHAVQLAVRQEAERCAARLNGHRGSAEVVGMIQSILSGFGGLASGVGGVFSAIDFGNPDITTAMGVMASAGAGITLIGNFVIGFFANPLEELRLHSQALRSWELAVELRYGGAEPDAVRESLARCARDEGPPVRTVGAGTAFSLEE